MLLAAALITVTFRGDWWGALLLAVFLFASIAFVLFEDRLPTLFDLLFVVAALLNGAGWVWGLYRQVAGYDEFTHFFTSFAVTLSLGFLVFRAVQAPFRDHRILFFLVMASFGITLGAFWEVFEWTILTSLPNPVVDIIMDSLGALLAGVAAAWFLGLMSAEDDPG